MKAYDIVLTAENTIEVNTYDVEVYRDKEKNPFYHFEFINSQKVENVNSLPEIIESLKQNNYFSISKLKPTSFNLEEGSVLYNLRALALPYNNKLLEKVYSEVVIDGMCHVFVYVTYVNVLTGELFALKANDLGMYSKELEENLERKGYKYITNSLLSYFELQDKKPFSLNRKK